MIIVVGLSVITLIAIDVIHRGMLDIHQNLVKSRVEGNPDADLHIIQFIDYLNLDCYHGDQLIRQFIQKHPEGVFLQTRFFPSEESTLASVYAECLSRQNKLREFGQQVYEHLGQWAGIPGDSIFQNLAKDVHADLSALENCVEDPQTMTAIMIDRAFGESLRVHTTPTYVLNAKIVTGVKDLSRSLMKWDRTLTESE